MCQSISTFIVNYQAIPTTIKLKMESNNNNNNNNNDDGEDEHEQLQRSAENRLANDGDKPAEAAGEEDQSCSSKKNRDEGNDLLDLEVCNLHYGLNNLKIFV
jgi:hypothetical protein